MRIGTWVIACLLLSAPLSVHAETRVALVIGNGSYMHTEQLRNPVRDARAIAAALTGLGYSVQLVTDATKSGMDAALDRFAMAANGAEHAVVFYSGHGIEVRGVNYLLPVDAQNLSETTISLKAIPLPTIMDIADSARQLGLVMLDACRNNPLGSGGSKGAKGLAAVEPVGGKLLVAYATKHGQTADDGTGPDSPYTTAILEALKVPGLEVGLFWRTVHDSVVSATRGAQEPFTYGALRATAIYIHPPAHAQVAPPVASADRELALWQSAQHNDTADAFRDYLKHYPEGLFSAQAKLRIAALTRAATGGTGVTPPPVSSNGPTTHTLTGVQDCNRLTSSTFEKIDGKAALEACERAVRESPGSVASKVHLGLGLALERLNRMEEAAASYRQAADQGDAAAQSNLGLLYSNGTGVKQSDTEAVKLFRLAADQGNASAQASLGFMYDLGRGVTQSDTEALKWYRKSADQGDPSAQNDLGTMYEDGQGVPKDRTEAVKWYRLSARQGNESAQRALRRLGEAVP
jgi:TPR repeat protein